MDFDKYNEFVKQMPSMIINNEENDVSVYLQIISNLIGNNSNAKDNEDFRSNIYKRHK